MEAVEDIVIVGAGIAGLTTALGLHRLGIKSLVLESSDGLRTTGFAFTTWTNAWRALDAVGIGEPLRQQHNQLFGLVTSSRASGLSTADRQPDATRTQRVHEIRCLQRKTLLETLEKELPSGTIRYSSKVVLIEELGYPKLVHLSDGSILKAKVLIGCDGVNSAVAKWLGFKKPAFVGRSAIRGSVYYEHGHGFEPKFFQYIAEGVRSGVVACNDKSIYWFFTFSSSSKNEEMEESPAKMKQFVLAKLGKTPDNVRAVIEKTELDNIILSPLIFRPPWEILLGNISKTNVCVAGDAFHPMTPDIGQGGCAALEDGIVLARCLGEALSDKQGVSSEEEHKRIEMGLQSYAKERRWRAFELISTAYMMGYIEQSNGRVLNFLRDRVLASFLARQRLKMASYDCGKLSAS
ncbi:monooxygenase 2-like [Syzygium oleosum]|uniref:monooxygenase 2-like n=1 Tax=Syzygium oleosum TaxID=219896 RepID=UPI0011D195B4|nr:monooxygenase 2-like [Syzygium oleosum]XP_056170016.1 monooxygenase 2-like [Syzygium oleosum]